MLQKYIELITGVAVGSDHMSSIQMMGSKAEEIVDDSVWVVKTHAPVKVHSGPTFFANKMIDSPRSEPPRRHTKFPHVAR